MSFLSTFLGTAYKEGMTEEELSNALETVYNAENTKLKTALSKANGEAADFKRQLRSKQSEEEAKEAERLAEYNKILDENKTLKRNAELASRSSKLVGMGYDAKLAESTAIAMLDGDYDTVMANQATFLEAQKKAINADAMRNSPRPQGGATTTSYQDQITEAYNEGDMAKVAYLTRLSQTTNNE